MGSKSLEPITPATARGLIRTIFLVAGKLFGRKRENDGKTSNLGKIKMSGKGSRRRPPLFSQELLDRRRRRPRAVIAAEEKINADVDRAVGRSLLDITAALQQRLVEAIGLLEAGKTADARALLQNQVAAIDRFEASILSQ